MKKYILFTIILLMGFTTAYSADLAGNVVASDIPVKERYQFYSTLGTYTSVEINIERDLDRPGGLGYVHNKGAQVIELFPNYIDDPGGTMNPITVPALTVWNASPNNLDFKTFKIRSTTAATLTIDAMFH